MKIGVDASSLSLPLTGIGRYTFNITEALLDQADLYGDEHLLYAPARPLDEKIQLSKNNLHSSRILGRMGRILWSQTALPWVAAIDDLDVFWGTSHRLPRYLPRRIARVVTIHDLVWKHAGDTMRPLSRWIEKRLMPEAIRHADRIIVDSESTQADLLASFSHVSKKVKVVHLGITKLAIPESSDALVALGVTKPYFLFVGTLEPRKNLLRLLTAYATLPISVRDACSFVVAGGKGWGGIDLPTLIKSLKLKNNVVLVGYVSDKILSTLYANARFLAMPSLYEGFGLPLLEAMSFGVPVMTSNCSSMPEVAGDACLLVDPLDVTALVRSLINLTMDDKLHADLAGKAILNVKRFSWIKAASQTREVFVEALRERDVRCSIRPHKNL